MKAGPTDLHFLKEDICYSSRLLPQKTNLITDKICGRFPESDKLSEVNLILVTSEAEGREMTELPMTKPTLLLSSEQL